MKNLFLALALSFSSFAFAQQSLKDAVAFKATEIQIDPQHATNVRHVSVLVNYAEKTATMVIAKRNQCAHGKMCVMMLPPPVFVTLPIVSVETDACGVLKVTALEDHRMVDGGLAKLTIEDATQLTCLPLIPIKSKAQFETNYYDRVNGMEVTGVSTMVLEEDPSLLAK